MAEHGAAAVREAGAFPLRNEIRTYAWGSTTAIPDLLGVEPTGEPQAEMWMGAHPGAPSRLRVGAEPGDALSDLASHIDADPVGELGPAVVEELGSRLPFLLKVLAAGQPVSLQAHPSLERARAGFADEDSRGVPRDAPERNYKDTNHKPEMLCALTPFETLCGFRDTAETVRLLDALGCQALGPYQKALCVRPGAEGLREVVTGLLTAPEGVRRKLVRATVESAQRALAQAEAGREVEFAAEYEWARVLDDQYPDDVGVVTALLLNLVRLRPGEAVYLPAGNLHACLRGVGVEIMASSDNVLRGGLTPKHVDVPELLRVLDFANGPAGLVTASPGADGEEVYAAPAREFRLSRLTVRTGRPVTVDTAGPQILLVVEGEARMEHGGGTLSLPRGSSAYVGANRPPVTLDGDAVVFRATTNLVAIPGH